MKKNVHLLPTIKPSKLAFLTKKSKEVYKDLRIFDRLMPNILDSENQNIFITSEEEIKVGDWCLSKVNEVIIFGKNYTKELYKKINLTTDQDLIDDGVQAIDEEFLNWYIKNLTCEYVEVETWKRLEGKYFYQIIPKEKITYTEATKFNDNVFNLKFGTKEFNDMCSIYFGGNPKHKNNDLQEFNAGAKWQQEKVHEALTSESQKESKEKTSEEEAAEIHSKKMWGVYFDDIHPDVAIKPTQGEISIQNFIEGAKWQKQQQDKNKYSEEEVKKISLDFFYHWWNAKGNNSEEGFNEWFEQYKKK